MHRHLLGHEFGPEDWRLDDGSKWLSSRGRISMPNPQSDRPPAVNGREPSAGQDFRNWMMSTITAPPIMRQSSKDHESRTNIPPPETKSAEYKAKRMLVETLFIAAFILPIVWLMDVYVDFLGPYRWLLVFLFVSGTAVGIIMSAILAGTMFADADDDDDLHHEY
jgi:hypothetical protein